jgi:hypothetical protein
MVMKLHSSGCKSTDRRNLKVDPEIHAMLAAFARQNNMTIITAANILIARSIATEMNVPIPPLRKQLADLVLKEIHPKPLG